MTAPNKDGREKWGCASCSLTYLVSQVFCAFFRKQVRKKRNREHRGKVYSKFAFIHICIMRRLNFLDVREELQTKLFLA